MAFRMTTGAFFDSVAFQSLSYEARNLYIALYYSSEAIRVSLPGMFIGGLALMAEAARMGIGDAQSAFTELLERKVVEHDKATRITIFLDLSPFERDRPKNPNQLKSMWVAWCDLPDCSAKKKWVAIFSAVVMSKTLPANYYETWSFTFGTVSPVDNPVDSSQMVQRTLFSESEGHNIAQQAISTISEPIANTPLTQPEHSSNLILSNLDLPEEGAGGSYPQAGIPPPPPNSGEVTLKSLCDTLRNESGGRVAIGVIDHRLGPALWDTVDALRRAGVDNDGVALAGQWLAAGGLHYRNDLDLNWVAKPGALIGAITQALTWKVAGRPDLRGANGSSNLSAASAAALEEIRQWDREQCPRDRMPAKRALKALRGAGGIWEMRNSRNPIAWVKEFRRIYDSQEEA